MRFERRQLRHHPVFKKKPDRGQKREGLYKLVSFDLCLPMVS